MWGGLSLITMNVHCMSLQRRVPATSLSVIVPSPELASYNSLITCLRNRTTKLYFLCLSGSRFLQVWELGWDHCRNSRITAPLLPPLGASPVGFRGFPSVVLDLIGWCCQVWDVKIPGASCTIERFNTRWLSCLWAAALQTGRTLFINICWLISCNSITSVKRWSWNCTLKPLALRCFARSVGRALFHWRGGRSIIQSCLSVVCLHRAISNCTP